MQLLNDFVVLLIGLLSELVGGSHHHSLHGNCRWCFVLLSLLTVQLFIELLNCESVLFFDSQIVILQVLDELFLPL